ncbi:CchlQ [Streptomyces sp. H10-C2]|uniref:CchlQ n=1 Tax=unclassified Streptomyces TaxID=2593676 RepID=UPI0024B90636|nr:MULTISPECIES: CchlQ [unclassified Streptomyces]MDJ0347133.1 CchlQ [Streptomyces sp. PH10-H1]MDJ0375379.1 CchlQ [Streptomyces sp. H10-C2]
MDWGTLVATVSGGSIAIAGTVLADYLRHRHDDDRSIGARRRAVYIEFITAAGACHARLRHIAQDPSAEPDLDAVTRAVLSDTGIYDARERLFIDAATAVAGAGQAMFEQLRNLQRAVAAGASLTSPAFHDAYHLYIGSVWAYRVAVRQELDGRSLSPATFGWDGWDGTDRCPLCRQAATSGT